MERELTFGKTPIGEIVKTLRLASSVGLFVEVTTRETTGLRSYKISAQRYLRQVKVILTFKREGKRVFSLKTFACTRVKILSLEKSLELEAERLWLVELGNQWYFQNTFGEPKVQD